MEDAVVVDDDVVDKESVESLALAHRAIACSTSVEMAPSLPPNTELELELELEVVVEEASEDMASVYGVLGYSGGSPR